MSSRRVHMILVVALSLVAASPAYADPKTVAQKKPKHPAPAAPAKPKPPAKDTSKPAGETKATPKSEPVPAGAASAHEVVEHESRIEFDERMVHGQSAAGAIFLFQRTPSEFKSIVQVPDSFRQKTIEMLQPRRGAL
jgi:hypothetical protein